MDFPRRDFLKVLGILGAGAGAAAGCSPLASYLPTQSAGFQDPLQISSPEWRALNRLSFGPRPEERQRLTKIGLGNYLEEQLSPEKISDHKTNLLLSRIEILEMDADALRNRGDKIFDNYDSTLVLDDFRQATTLRQVYSKKQLEEVLVEFWTDHFNISVQKGDCWFLKIVDDREVIRKHALGNFRELLGASAHSPAMLVYLDNQENHKDAPNENYARELLELHSLGVQGGYSQEDVMELARCLTGWRIKEHFWRGELKFDQDTHTPGVKTVLGETIQPAGKGELDQVLDILVKHPSTAETICTKLARRFLADDPPREIVNKASQVFLESRGDIKAVLRVILLDGFPYIVTENSPLKYKRPVNYLVSALRSSGAETDGGRALQRYLKSMGQPLYDWPTPDGYPDTAASWQGNLLPRWRFALDLVQNQIKGTRFDLESYLVDVQAGDASFFVDHVANNFLGGSLPPGMEIELLSTLEETISDNPRQAAEVVIAGVLASPAFQWR
ncbi:MAG TPA: DUF1800 domain-containing protein [Chloroflexi bacterium]|nr:DUF1800 domain-containing protein [Chloroflexota bacterium]